MMKRKQLYFERKGQAMRTAQLRYFVTIAQLENLSQAAELLHISQSSLSKNLSSLESELGIPLFQRSGRRLILNPAGARLLEYSSMVLRELDYALDDMRLLSSGNAARIRIGAAGMSDDFTRCLAAFRKIHPGTEFEITGGIEGVEHLDINSFDMLIYPQGLRYKKYTGYPLYQERYALAAAAGHPLAKSPFLRVRALEGQDVVFMRSGHAAEEYPYQICSAMAIRFGSVCFADSREFHRQMIADGLCVGFVPDGCASFYRGGGDLRLVPIQDKRFSRQMMVCFRREKTLSPFAIDFRDFVLDYFSVNTQDQAGKDSSRRGV